MAFDRSKYKPTQGVALKQADKESENAVRGRTNTADYIQVPAKDGQGNKISGTYSLRIFPYHPDGGGSLFAETKVVHWLKCMQPKRDGEKRIIIDPKTGKAELELRSKSIFNSRIHGGTEKDIIEEYIKYAEKVAKENYPGNEKKQKAFLEPIFGSPFVKGKTAKYNGIMARQTWVMYANLVHPGGAKEFGRVEIGKAVKQRLNAITASEGADEVLGTDPFTDIKTGRLVKITYNGSATKSQDYYTTELDSSFDKVTEKANLAPLSDEELEKFEQYPSLYSTFVNVYKKKDYDLALEGLKILDDAQYEMFVDGKKEAFTLGIFAYDDFLDSCEEISDYYPDEVAQGPVEEEQEASEAEETEVEKPNVFAKKNAEQKKSASVVAAAAEEESEIGEDDPFEQMDRQELIEFARDNRTGIIITNKTTDELARNKLRTWHAQNFGNDKMDVEVEEPKKEKKGLPVADDLPWKDDGTDKKVSEKVATKPVVKSKIDQLRANVAAKKGK